ncbi:MAG TPA: hypothetical protein VMV77_02295 [Bacteroidales bacterium]|nr:hypothetical protein [Bacteroidales bacterium]
MSNIIGVNAWSKVARSRLCPIGRIRVDFMGSYFRGYYSLYAFENMYGYKIGDFIKRVRMRDLNDYKVGDRYECVLFERKEVLK